jgi:hypothetical protein
MACRVVDLLSYQQCQTAGPLNWSTEVSDCITANVNVAAYLLLQRACWLTFSSGVRYSQRDIRGFR